MSAALLDHLWQSTLFAFGAWLISRLLRKNGAHLRHAVWLAASIKFLVPFSLLVGLGAALRTSLGIEGTRAAPVFNPGAAAEWLATPARALSVPLVDGGWTSAVIAVWLLGALALIARCLARWRRAIAVARAAVPSAIAGQIPVWTSSSLREPAVVGIVRPVLLLPAGIENCLTTEQLDAIVVHELSHVQRHDNLTAAVHMLVEAVFWFHPLVWWIGARMIAERERACDEAVVRAGADRRAYAEGILQVCRSYLASDLACVAGVSGAELKTRLEAIMKADQVNGLGAIKRLSLGALAFCAVAAPVSIGMTSSALAAGAAEQGTRDVGRIELLPGRRVQLRYANVDVRALIRAMGEAANVNILVSDKVSGHVTVQLAEMPWEQAFDIILNSQGLVKREKDGILFIDQAAA